MRKALCIILAFCLMSVQALTVHAVGMADTLMSIAKELDLGPISIDGLEQMAGVEAVPGAQLVKTHKKAVCNNSAYYDILTQPVLMLSFGHLAKVIMLSENIGVKAFMEQTAALQGTFMANGKAKMNLEGMLAQEEMVREAKIQAYNRQMDIVNVCEGSVGKAYSLAFDDAIQLNAAMAADDRNIGMGISSSSAETWTLLGNMARQLEHNRDFTFFPSSGTLDDTDLEDMTLARNILLSSVKNPRPDLDKMNSLTQSKYLTGEMNSVAWRVLIGEGLRQWQVSRMPLIDFGDVQMWLGAFKTTPIFKTTTQQGQVNTDVLVSNKQQEVKKAGNGTFNPLRKSDCKEIGPDPGQPNRNLIAQLGASGRAPGTPIPNIHGLCEKYANKYNINPDFFKAMISRESWGGRNVPPKSFPINSEAAMGPGQMKLSTAKELGCANTVDELMNPEVNLDCAARYLKKHLDKQGGDYLAALVSYNAGEGTLNCYRRNGPEWPNKPMPCRGGVWRWKGYEWAHCHTLAILGVPIENVLDGSKFELPVSEGSKKIDMTYLRTPERPMTTAELKRVAETERTLGIGDKISITTFFDLVGQRAISQDYMARISSIGNDADETDDERNESLGALYGEMLRLLSWKFMLMADMRKTFETNNLLKSLKTTISYDDTVKKADAVIK